MSGERKNGVRVLVSLGVVVGVLGLFAAPALAAPETPEATEATEVTSTSARINGVLNPGAKGEPGLYSFVHAAAPEPCEDSNQETAAVYDAGEMGEHVAAKLEGLLPATTYTYCLIAENSGEGERIFSSPETFTTPPAAPTVSEQAVVIVGASTATVSAEISPGGLSTGYHVEFVPQAQFEAEGWTHARRVPATTDAELPAMSTPTPVSEELTGLQAGEEYVFRFVAANECEAGKRCVTEGLEATLTTAGSNLGSALPDGRAYELVSTEGSGELYLPPTPLTLRTAAPESRSRLPFRAAASGEAVTYIAEPAAEGGTGETGPGLGNQWLARRGAGGWSTENITPPDNLSSVFQSFTDDLTTAFYEGGTKPLAEPGEKLASAPVEEGCAALYTRNNGSGVFSSLFSSGVTPKNCGLPLFAGATADESQIIFQSEAALTTNAQEATEIPSGHEERHGAGESEGQSCMFGCNLYDVVGGQLRLVNVLPGLAHETAPNATFGGYAGRRKLTDFSNAISTDGSRIFWTDTEGETGKFAGEHADVVYVLENGANEVRVSGAGPAQYWTATPDGDYAYYTENGELWRFDTQKNEGEPLETKGLEGENAEVQGVIGTNQEGADGAYVYFVANGVLADNENANRETPKKGHEEGNPNLYVDHEGVTSFIATLSSADGELEAFGEGLYIKASVWGANVGERLAEVTPDGEGLVFESDQELTGYDNYYENTPTPEVFVYSADDGGLACASCNPTGALPVSNEHQQTKLPESAEAYTFAHRWISENGNRVFFDSEQPLVKQDTDGVQDVYEWEREGEGTCTPQTPARSNDGCVFLLSGGTSREASFLIDASATGEDVFFEHVGRLGQVLGPVDHNELYDARVGGGVAQVASSCAAGGCEAPLPASVPALATPASAAFSGIGNFSAAAPVKVAVKSLTRAQKLAKALKGCRKDRSKTRRLECEKGARTKYGVKKVEKAKKAGAERRAK